MAHLPRTPAAFLAAAVAMALLARPVQGQTLVFALFERYLDSLRLEAGLPGLSAAIVQNNEVVWERGMGYRDVEGALPALPDTPYPVADLTQAITAGLLLDCVDRNMLRLDEPIGTFVPAASGATNTLRQLLTHAAPVSGFRYDPTRFALLAHPVEDCFAEPFRKVLTSRVFDRFSMIDAVPGYDIASVPAELRLAFDEGKLVRYADTLKRMAVPYRVDRRRRALRSDMPPAAVDGAHGIVASARDLAQFDKAVDEFLLARPALQALSWTNATHNGVNTPVGMGWFVQQYQGEKLVWQFGNSPDAFSSLMLKVPGRRLTLILLANSDGLSAPFPLSRGDVTSSSFAQTFLGLFL